MLQLLPDQATRLSAPRRKSTGFVTTSTRMPAGTAIISPLSQHTAQSAMSRHRSQTMSEPFWSGFGRTQGPADGRNGGITLLEPVLHDGPRSSSVFGAQYPRKMRVCAASGAA